MSLREHLQRRRRRRRRAAGHQRFARRPVGGLSNLASITGALDIAIGLVTFTGSLIAAGKLQGWITGKPLVFPGARLLNGMLIAAMVADGAWLAASPATTAPLVLLAAAGVFGVMTVLPIGGADMPVVISLLNACTGTAVAMAGFVLDKTVLIIAGALVGAAGSILTKLMADAMNRSLANIIVGGFGTVTRTSRFRSQPERRCGRSRPTTPRSSSAMPAR